jgi:hypothetical protein
MRKLIAVLFVLALIGPAAAERVGELPSRTTAIGVTSGDVAAATATATLTAPTAGAGASNYLCGFDVRGTGATSAATVAVTVAGLVGGSQTYQVLVVAGATTATPSLTVHFPVCLKGTPEAAVTVSMPTWGTGALHAMINAWGYVY